MLETPRSRHGWILLVIGVLVASTIVTATLTAALTQVLFPDGFLVDTEGRKDPRPPPPSADRPESALSGFGLRASVTCAITFGNVEDSAGPENLRP